MGQHAEQFYRRLFKATPGKVLVLRPDSFEIIAVTDEYLQATMTCEDAILGRTIFEVFPDSPDDPQADGVKNLSASLRRAQGLKLPDVMGSQRYPVRAADGTYEERFWSPVNTPVLDETGDVEFIMHRVEDITSIVQESVVPSPQGIGGNNDPLAVQDIILRSRELRQALSKLQEHEARMRTAERMLKLGTWEYYPASGNLSWSEQVFEIYDLPINQPAPDSEAYFTLLHPEDRKAALEVYLDFATKRASQIEFKHRIITRDGSVRYVKGMGERHNSADGEIVVGYVQDITPLIHTRRKLTQAEQLLNLAGEKAQLGGWRVDIESGANTWTSETSAIHGMPEDYSPAGVDEAIEFYKPEYRDQVRVAFERCAVEGEGFDLICQLQAANGRTPWVRAIGVPERDNEGRIYAVQGAFQDISPLRYAQAKASEADQQRLNVLESISDAFYALDKDWNFTFVNQQAYVFLDRVGAQLTGKNVWAEFPEAYEQLKSVYEAAVASRETKRFQIFYDPLGKWFDISAYPIPEGLAVYFRDVTLQKQQEMELQHAQERFQLISIATNDVIWDWNFATGRVEWNDSMATVFGYCQAELEPGPESWSGRIHPEDLDAVLDSIYEVINGEETFWSGEYRFLKKDGQFAYVMDRGFLVRDETGKATRMVGSMLDITERKEIEKRLRESQKLEAVGHLTGGVAHDFNNLLTVILGNAEILAEFSTDPKLRPMAEMTLSAAKRGAELTSRLLAFARRTPLDPKAVGLNHQVQAMRPLIRRTMPESIEQEYILDPDLGVAEIDASELDTALLNLVVNARDAMQGGGTLTIETANAVLDDDYAQQHSEVVPGDYVMICVSDTGAGMGPETVRQAFEPFFTTKTVGKGSGLGLSMVFGFTKQSGGHIKIYSEPGEGTSVKLYFPRTSSTQSLSYQPEVRLPVQNGTEHILVAEDDDLVLAHLTGQLRSLGYRVTAVRSGPEAMNALQTSADIDLLLTDIIMPGGMNGRELADLARATHPNLKILFTSGYTENAIVHHGRLDPGVELLSKPYTRLELANKVRQVIQGKGHC